MSGQLMPGMKSMHDILDELTYRQYSANRAFGIKPETLAHFFGEEPCERWSRRYESEMRQA